MKYTEVGTVIGVSTGGDSYFKLRKEGGDGPPRYVWWDESVILEERVIIGDRIVFGWEREGSIPEEPTEHQEPEHREDLELQVLQSAATASLKRAWFTVFAFTVLSNLAWFVAWMALK